MLQMGTANVYYSFHINMIILSLAASHYLNDDLADG